MNIIAVTSCATGIAHSYMAAETIEKVAKQQGHEVKVEIQGALGIENRLSAADIAAADLMVFANDVGITEAERFEGASAQIARFTPHDVIRDPGALLPVFAAARAEAE
ncbi:MAG: fructose PTS transporter subunit IIB [Microbacterium sp.]